MMAALGLPDGRAKYAEKLSAPSSVFSVIVVLIKSTSPVMFGFLQECAYRLQPRDANPDWQETTFRKSKGTVP